MNKTELISEISEKVEMSKKDTERVLAATLETIASALMRGDNVQLVGFGTFEVKDRAARTGRNPQTGDAIQIAASKIPSFKPSKALKDLLK